MIYSFGGSGSFELLGLGNQPHQHGHADPDRRRLLGARHVREQHHRGRAAAKRLRAVPPRISLSPFEGVAHARMESAIEPYKLRDRPVGTREFSKTQEGSCKGECSVQLTGLKPEPYEVILKNPEGKEGHEKTGASSAPRGPVKAGRPTSLRPRSAADQRRNGQETSPRPDAHRGAGRMDERTHRSPTSGCAARATAKPAPAKNSAPNVNRSRSAKARPPAKPMKSSPRTWPARSSATVEAKNASGSSVAVSHAGSDPRGRRRIRTALPDLDLAADDHRCGGGRTHAHGPPGRLGKLTDELRGQVVPLQSGQPKKAIGATCAAITVKNGMGENEPVTGETYVTENRRRRLLDRGAGARRKPRRV